MPSGIDPARIADLMADEVATFVAADLVPPGAVRSGADGETAAEEVRSGRSDKAGGALARLRRLGPDGHPTVGTVPAYRSVEEAVRSYLRTGNIAETARELFCHRNTVTNRLRRFHELTGIDLTVPEQAARAVVAFS